MAPTGRKDVYVKIPKVIYYDRAKQVLGPVSSDDIQLAEDEYDSLLDALTIIGYRINRACARDQKRKKTGPKTGNRSCASRPAWRT